MMFITWDLAFPYFNNPFPRIHHSLNSANHRTQDKVKQNVEFFLIFHMNLLCDEKLLVSVEIMTSVSVCSCVCVEILTASTSMSWAKF